MYLRCVMVAYVLRVSSCSIQSLQFFNGEDLDNRAAGSFLISSHPCADCERPRRHLCFQLFLYLYESLQLLARKPLHGFKISVEAMHILPK